MKELAQERAAFESWANDQGFVLTRVVRGDDYQDLRTQGPWEAWQARALAAPMPQSAGVTDALRELLEAMTAKFPADSMQAQDAWSARRSNAIDAARSILALAPGLSGWQEIDGDVKRAKEILARLCDQGLLSMSIPVRNDDEDMVLSRVINALAPGLAPHQPQPEGERPKPIYATAKNTPAVRTGHEMGGYLKNAREIAEWDAKHQPQPEPQEAPIECGRCDCEDGHCEAAKRLMTAPQEASKPPEQTPTQATEEYSDVMLQTFARSYDVNYSGRLIEMMRALLSVGGEIEFPSKEASKPEPDMRAICEALGFDPTNHHNAAKCPYCRPAESKEASKAAPVADESRINGEAPNAHNLLAALIDIYDDAQNNPPEHRCYIDSAWSDILRESRAFVASQPEPTSKGDK